MLAPLAPGEIAKRLPALPGWQLKGKTIEKHFRFGDFKQAIAFVNRVADLAEAKDHHPDIFIHYRDVTLVLWTHVAGGVTERDLGLAAELLQLEG